jgi:hypothetical protein
MNVLIGCLESLITYLQTSSRDNMILCERRSIYDSRILNLSYQFVKRIWQHMKQIRYSSKCLSHNIVSCQEANRRRNHLFLNKHNNIFLNKDIPILSIQSLQCIRLVARNKSSNSLTKTLKSLNNCPYGNVDILTHVAHPPASQPASQPTYMPTYLHTYIYTIP